MTHSRHAKEGIKERRFPPGTKMHANRVAFLRAVQRQAPSCLEELRDGVLPACEGRIPQVVPENTPAKALAGIAPPELVAWGTRYHLTDAWLLRWSLRTARWWKQSPVLAAALDVGPPEVGGWTLVKPPVLSFPERGLGIGIHETWEEYERRLTGALRKAIREYRAAHEDLARVREWEEPDLKRTRDWVTPEVRADWLARYQVLGESWTEVAQMTKISEGVDGKYHEHTTPATPARVRVYSTSFAKSIKLTLRKRK